MTNDFNKELSAHSPSLADALGVRPGITAIIKNNLADSLGVRPGITAIIKNNLADSLGVRPGITAIIKNNLADSLGVRPGITAIIGSGGKTSLMRALSRELSAGGSRVLLTTTTHILPFKDLPCLRISMKEDASWVLDKLAGIDSLAGHDSLAGTKTPVREICFGSGLLPGCGAGFDLPAVESTEKPYYVSAGKPYSVSAGRSASFNPKLSEPGFPLYELLTGADYILAEADGARHHYMKAHAHYEPVIPERCGRTILVIGAQGFGMRAAEAVHRPEIFCRLTGAHLDDIVTPALYAGFLRRELEGGLAFDCVLINGVDCERRRDLSAEFAEEFAGCFGGPVVFADLPLA